MNHRLGLSFWVLMNLSLSLVAQNGGKHAVFLIGDAGEPDGATYNLEVLKNQIEKAGEHATLIFLGDNIYPHGLPDADDPDRKKYEQKLVRQLEITKNFKGKTIVMPGNHDWAKGREEGWAHVKNQTKFVGDYFDSQAVFYPKNGYPGPEEIKLDDGIFLIVFDMQWMFHRWPKPLTDHPLEHHEGLDVMVDIGELLEKHKNDHVILAAHHPLYSYGLHGGKFSAKQHLFPLTDINSSLYVPLPIVGSLYPVYRSTAGSIQDIPHPVYKAIRNGLEEYLLRYPNVTSVGGHEHSLQHIAKDGVNYVVSGSGSKTTYVKKSGEHLKFSESRLGFGRLNFEMDGTTHLEFWAADGTSPAGEKIYETPLYQRILLADTTKDYPDYDFKDRTATAKGSLIYQADKGQIKLMGANYRDVWALDMEVPIFNIREEHGGLEIIKQGGGLQTNSLRMKAPDGKQYVLRSVEKYPNRALPQVMQKTIAVSVIQDQISASHPYAAFIIPPMAEAIGIYHTNPKLVYVPDDGALGKYRKTFANTLVLYEERPAKDWSDTGLFGGSDDLVNTQEVLTALQKDNDNRVDQKFVLKNRMFDMIIGDWDRHEDQWRWASFKEAKGTLYKPIARDRDQAFFVNQGFFPKIASRKWGIPKVEGFNKDVRWSPGLNFNARFFDRLFLNATGREDWEETARIIQKELTDEVIEDAVSQWPQNVYALTGKSTIEILKARRDNLPQYALELYDFLAREVEIILTDKKELVQIDNVSKEAVSVTVRKISKSGKIDQIIYQRTFSASETKEIRIYGLAGQDEFKISGQEKSKIKVRVIGGKNKDLVVDNTTGKSAGNVRLYDKKSTAIEGDKPSVKNRLSDDRRINEYDKYGFQYDVLMPLVYVAINRDDGFFLGGGLMYTQHGWRKKPFASQHLVMANIAFATGAFNVRYAGKWTDVIGRWDANLNVRIQEPFSVNNFFGLGNESGYDFENQSIDYYRLRIVDNLYRLGLSTALGGFGEFTFGVQHRGVEVRQQDNKYISSPEFDEFDTEDLFSDERYYSGAYASLVFDTRDEQMLTTRGLLWSSEVSSFQGWGDRANDFTNFRTELGLYYSLQFPPVVTIASRTGYAHNFGKFVKDEFYNANTLGGQSNLRGFRRTRFYGRTSFYQNVDLRIKLFNFQSVLFPGKVGVLGFYDIGRVWIDTEQSDLWHRSAGFGVWVAPLSKVVLSVSLAFTEEENLPFFDFGFFF